MALFLNGKQVRGSLIVEGDLTMPLPTVSTASGSVATFDTDLTENLIECVCDILYQGTGGGTPQAPNPITVYSSLNLSHSGADTSNPTIINIPFGQLVAIGSLDVLNGKIEADWLGVDLGSLTYNYNANKLWFQIANFATTYNAKLPENANTATNAKCEIYTPDTQLKITDDLTVNYAFDIFQSGALVIRNTDYTDPATFKTAMSGKYLIFECPSTQTIQISSNQVQALLNENNIWCDTNGNTSVKYLLSVGKKIS